MAWEEEVRENKGLDCVPTMFLVPTCSRVGIGVTEKCQCHSLSETTLQLGVKR